MVSPKQVPKIEIHDENARIVKGWGTVDVFDKVNERLPIEEFKRIMPIIMKRGGIVMNRHTNQPAGKILNYNFLMKDTPDGPREGVYLETEVYKDFGSDDEVWEGIKKGDIEGFSFGGKSNLEDVEFSKGFSQKTLKGLEGFEFSYVPKGCNQEATIEEVNFIAKEEGSEEGETSQDSGHYHLYKIGADGNGQTLGTLPREAEDHVHEIKQGVVQTTNEHDHRLIRMLVTRTEKVYDGEKKPDSEKEENTDDKTLSKSDSTLDSDGKKNESIIKNKVLNKTMGDEEVKKSGTEKIEDVPEARSTGEAPEESVVDPMAQIETKLDQVIGLLSGNTMKTDDEDKDKDKDDDKDVEKEGDGEKVKLPESTGDEISQDPPAEGEETDDSSVNFLEKEGIAKIKAEAKAEAKAEIMKELEKKSANTPRTVVKSHGAQETEGRAVAKNWAEANKTIKKMGLN